MEENLYQRMAKVALRVKSVFKENKRVNGQYTFVSHDAVVKALHDPIAEAGIVVIPSIKELTQDGNRTTAKVAMVFINADKPSERIETEWYGYGIDTSDKGVGKAVSYAYKYALLKTFMLETCDDVERDHVDHKPDPLATLKALASKCKVSLEEFRQYVSELASLRGFTEEEVIKVMKSNESKVAANFKQWQSLRAA